jgi:hypothetical protein
MTVAFKELAGSPIEVFGIEGIKAERRLLCAYEDRYTVVTALLGDGGEFGGNPQCFYPNCGLARAIRVRIEPFEKKPDDQGAFDDLTADLNGYSGQFVELVVGYEALGLAGHPPHLPAPEQGTFLTYRMDFGGEYVALPGQSLQWQSDATLPVPPEAVPTLRVPIIEHHVTWQRVINPPWDAIRACVGSVNAASFLGAAAETLLFDGAKADRQFTGLDDLQEPQFGWRITYVFREKTIRVLDAANDQATYGWNHCYCSVPLPSAGWDRLVDSQGNAFYRTADFSPLFQFAAV